MNVKLRLIWRKGISDYNGVLAEYIYKTDIISLPDDSKVFQFPDVKKYGYFPELIGCEFVVEKDGEEYE